MIAHHVGCPSRHGKLDTLTIYDRRDNDLEDHTDMGNKTFGIWQGTFSGI
ncbi:hypothetical protein I3J27_38765 [Bradyrhizobium xenonodulans]|uniref:Transposase n=1 Tax=Bradyrhizobium xenonodulans TaxID=2736875 RepID=A0ABY7MN38_9BRAD|nr:hypothetical protein [Bradyrhizobium xenonodulans]WBL78807.1 hypothetical protein I3J27_38765 [Bradyrhizobium xenonodulans]